MTRVKPHTLSIFHFKTKLRFAETLKLASVAMATGPRSDVMFQTPDNLSVERVAPDMSFMLRN